MKKLTTFVVTVLLCLSVKSQTNKTILITGNVSGDTKGSNYILFYTNKTPVDSVKIVDGKFEIELEYSKPMLQFIVTQYEKVIKKSYRPFPLFIDGNGDINIDLDIEKGFFEATISGPGTTVDYKEFVKAQLLVSKKSNDIVIEKFGKAFLPSSDPNFDKLNDYKDSVFMLGMGTLVSQFVLNHKNDYLGVYVLSTYGKNFLKDKDFEKCFQSLSKNLKVLPEAEQVESHVNGIKATQAGAKVKNFILNDPSGKPISFESFKGKYVWIDFWASWCGPCKMAFPHMKELYAKYKDKGLTILGISTDTKIEPWLKSLVEIQNPWPQVWDSKNIKKDFAVTAYPTSFLIGPDGRIILKEIGYNPNGLSVLDKKLNEVFN